MYIYLRGSGMRPTRDSFLVVLCVCTFVRAVWLPGGSSAQTSVPDFPFSLWPQDVFPFPLWDYRETKVSPSETK